MEQDQSPLRSARPFPSEENPVCFTYNETNEESDELRNTSYYCDLCKLLCVVFGFENWRPGQLAACVCAIEGKDVVITLATGFGKSLCYQLPAVYQYAKDSAEKITVVIVPLVSLMKDQLRKILDLNLKAFGFYAGLDPALVNECNDHLMNPVRSNPNFLFLTPEGLESRLDSLQKLHQDGKIARFVVDEAQCVLRKPGDDFRQLIGNLTLLRKQFPTIPLTLLSGSSGTQDTRNIISKFGLSGCYIISGVPYRDNIHYSIVSGKGGAERHQQIVTIIRSQPVLNSGIIYCRTVKHCENLVSVLREAGIKAEAYNGAKQDKDRNRVYKDWIENRIQIVVATNAFGLGIDKPDVRCIIHRDVPKDIDQYIQETGRAGRDGLLAKCVMFYNYNDVQSNYALMFGNKYDIPGRAEAISKGSHALIRMCEDTKTCRRSHVISHYGLQQEQVVGCGNCDICCMSEHTSSIIVDCRELAWAIIQEVDRVESTQRSWTEPRPKIKVPYTFMQLCKYIADAKGATQDAIEQLPFELTSSTVGKIIVKLIMLGVFEEHGGVNSGYPCWYIRLRRPVTDLIGPLEVHAHA